jgi:IclR family transcriptional regulator, pca regulon regulatory protein
MARLRPRDAEQRRADARGGDFLEALARGLRVITVFDAERRQMTLSDAARVLDLPRATVRRALYTLGELGYLETDGKLFRLTPKILDLAAAYLTSNAVSVVLQPTCERLANAVGESSTAAVLDGQDAVMIARAAPTRQLPVGVGIGYRVPAFCSALGRVLLAALDDAALDRFLAALRPTPETARTVLDKARLREAILTVRAHGFAFVDQEAEAGFRSIAVPVRRYDGVVVCALNIGARVERAPAETMLERHLPLLRETAAGLTTQLI